jgi:hypothetical protein
MHHTSSLWMLLTPLHILHSLTFVSAVLFAELVLPGDQLMGVAMHIPWKRGVDQHEVCCKVCQPIAVLQCRLPTLCEVL